MACVTTGDISLDELPELGPVIRATDQLTGLEDTKMSCCGFVMAVCEDIALDVVVVWDYDTTFVEQEVVVQGIFWIRILVGSELSQQLLG